MHPRVELPGYASLEESVELDECHEECGVVGVWFKSEARNVAELIGDGLETIQHRGQEAAGVAVGDETGCIEALKDVGLVRSVMGGNKLAGLSYGRMAIGHVRYGTVGVKNPQESFHAAGPALAETDYGDIALGHNGDVLNVDEICLEFGLEACKYTTDSAVLTAAVAAARVNCDSLPEAVVKVFSKVNGAFSIVLMGEGQLIGLRDPHGFRPLMLGVYPDNDGYAIASETPALSAMDARFRREITRGEMVVCNPDGTITSTFPFPEQPSKLCAFEFIYFSAPHGELEGRSVHMVRKQMGSLLYREHPVEADAVVGVPDSGIPGAEGFAQASSIPNVTGLIRNRYLGRTFIVPGQQSREEAVKRKLHVNQSEIYQRRLVIVDDSIIRGTTTKAIVAMLREAGAAEIHLRITSAPYKWPCFYGMDTKNPEDFIANQFPELSDLEDYLGVDSLRYLSLAGLRAAASDAAGKLCMACMDGNYPTPIDAIMQSKLL